MGEGEGSLYRKGGRLTTRVNISWFLARPELFVRLDGDCGAITKHIVIIIIMYGHNLVIILILL